MRRILFCCALLGLSGLSFPSAAASSVTVTIDSSLHPSDLRLAPGMAVTWRNADDERHRVRTIEGPARFDSGNLDPGQQFTVTLNERGTYRYLDDRNRDNSAYWGTIVVGSEGGASEPAGSPPSSQPLPEGQAPPAASVAIANRAFDPQTVAVRAGGTVSWSNRDDRSHTVTARRGGFDSGMLSAGAGFEWSFPTQGTFEYFCQLHPEMTGTVQVGGGGSAGTAPDAGSRPAIGSASAPGGAGSGGAKPLPRTEPRAGAGPATAEASSVPTSGRVAIVDFDFDPGSVTIAAGGIVTWRNAGEAPHTASAGDGSFDSGVLPPGQSFSFRFGRPGTFAFRCNLHPQMQGTVEVKAVNAASAGAGTETSGAEPAPAVEGLADHTEPAGAGPRQPPSDGPDSPLSAASPAIPLAAGGGVGLAVGIATAPALRRLRRLVVRH